MKSTVAVVIPCHNQGDTLARAIESALEADEVIVVDDASTDTTRQVITDYTDRHNNVQWYTPGWKTMSGIPAGVCHARNLGIHWAESDLIIPLDADDYFLPGGIPALVSAWQPGKFVVGGWRETYDRIIGWRVSADIAEQVYEHRDVKPAPIGTLDRKNIAQATWLFAKADWQRVGGYDPRFNIGCEDWAFMRALVRAGVQGVTIPDVIYAYTVRENGRAAWCKRHWDLIHKLVLASEEEFV